MDPNEKNPHRLENFQAHRHARDLAVHTLQLLGRSPLRESGVLVDSLGEAVLTQDETPEAVCDLIATLADMDAQDFSHGCSSSNWV